MKMNMWVANMLHNQKSQRQSSQPAQVHTPDSATSSGSAPASTSSGTAPAEDNFETRFEQMVEEIVLPVLPEEEEEDFSSMEDLCSSDSSSSDSEEEEDED